MKKKHLTHLLTIYSFKIISLLGIKTTLYVCIHYKVIVGISTIYSAEYMMCALAHTWFRSVVLNLFMMQPYLDEKIYFQLD